MNNIRWSFCFLGAFFFVPFVLANQVCHQARQEVLKSGPVSASGLLPIPLGRAFGDSVGYEIGWGFDLRRYRNYDSSGGFSKDPGSARAQVHTAIDLRVDAGTPVINVRKSRVEKMDIYKRGIGTEFNLTLREVSPSGQDTDRLWGYVHLDGNLIPDSVTRAQEQKLFLEPGALLGYVRSWEFPPGIPPQVDVMDNQVFHHLHFELQSGKVHCDLMPILDYSDHVAPKIENLLVVGHDDLVLSNARVGQPVDVVIETFDQVNSAKDSKQVSPFQLHNFRKIVIEIRGTDSRLVYQNTIQGLDSFPKGEGTLLTGPLTRLFPMQLKMIDGSDQFMVGDVHGRKFFVRLTAEKTFIPKLSGQYQIDVWIEDQKGNRSHSQKSLNVEEE